jgi:hypothetical protein
MPPLHSQLDFCHGGQAQATNKPNTATPQSLSINARFTGLSESQAQRNRGLNVVSFGQESPATMRPVRPVAADSAIAATPAGRFLKFFRRLPGQ